MKHIGTTISVRLTELLDKYDKDRVLWLDPQHNVNRMRRHMCDQLLRQLYGPIREQLKIEVTELRL